MSKIYGAFSVKLLSLPGTDRYYQQPFRGSGFPAPGSRSWYQQPYDHRLSTLQSQDFRLLIGIHMVRLLQTIQFHGLRR